MDAYELVKTRCTSAKKASYSLSTTSVSKRNEALENIANLLCKEENTERIISANLKDTDAAKDNGISDAMVDRLRLDKKRIEGIASALRKLIALPDVLGAGEVFTRPNGLIIRRVRVPIGVAAVIYESRPNVTVDAAAICLKTGNAAVLRGGKEAINTNIVLVEIMKEGITAAGLDGGCVELIDNTSRDSSRALMEARGLVDVLIPRGGAGLIRAVCENAKVPVIETGAGNCHLYVEKSADLDMALKVCCNAKLSRPAVCNAAENLLVDREIAKEFLPMFACATKDSGLVIRGDKECADIIKCENATDEDFFTEYDDLIISVKVVNGVDEAIEHINAHSTHHSEAILTQNVSAAELFKSKIDSAAVYVNASTRFTDGEEFGFGAEIGISTQKLHARGPMGPEQLTSIKYIIEGNGQTR